MRGKKRGSLGKALSVTPVPEVPPCVMVREVQGELEVQPMDRSDHTHDPVQPISLAHRPQTSFLVSWVLAQLGSLSGGKYRQAKKSTTCVKFKDELSKNYNQMSTSHKMLQNMFNVCFGRIKQLIFLL